MSYNIFYVTNTLLCLVLWKQWSFLEGVICFGFWILVFWDRAYLCSPGCPWTRSVDLACLEHTEIWLPPPECSEIKGMHHSHLEQWWILNKCEFNNKKHNNYGTMKSINLSSKFLLQLFMCMNMSLCVCLYMYACVYVKSQAVACIVIIRQLVRMCWFSPSTIIVPKSNSDHKASLQVLLPTEPCLLPLHLSWM